MNLPYLLNYIFYKVYKTMPSVPLRNLLLILLSIAHDISYGVGAPWWDLYVPLGW